MPFPRPTLADLRTQIRQDMQSGILPGVLSVTRVSVLYVFSNVWAGLAHLHNGYIDWIARQGVPWTATDENLEGWSNLKGITRKPASAASGQVTFSAASGSSLPAGTDIQLSGSGTVQVTDTAVEADGQIVAHAQAIAPGNGGNAPVGTAATLASPVAGVQTTGSVTAPFTGGAETEQDDALRSRMLKAFATGGENGAEQDYVNWALSVPGVTRAWCNGNGFGAGTVVVYVMLDGNTASGGYPIGTDGAASDESRTPPATGDQLRVVDALYPLRPVTALVIVCAPIKQPVDFIIADLGDANTPANQQRITQALAGVFRAASRPGGTVYPSAWLEAMAALDLPHYAILQPIDAVSAQGTGFMPDLGTITFRS